MNDLLRIRILHAKEKNAILLNRTLAFKLLSVRHLEVINSFCTVEEHCRVSKIYNHHTFELKRLTSHYDLRWSEMIERQLKERGG